MLRDRHSSVSVVHLDGLDCWRVHLRNLPLLASDNGYRAQVGAEIQRIISAIQRDGAVTIATETGELLGWLTADAQAQLSDGYVLLCLARGDGR